MRRAEAGFTLMELLVVIAIAAVLTGLAIPSFRTSINSAESRDAATSFYSALARARSEAIARNAEIHVCARSVTNLNTATCSNGSGAAAAWRNGWIVYQGASPTDVLLIHEPIADQLLLGGAAGSLTFLASGGVNVVANFDLCRGTGDVNGRRISVSRSGRVALEPRSC
ncbi:MAG: GspH/FimT family pseudopilin [Pseudomonadota bacterium]